MKIAVFTLTRDRIEYTKCAFASLCQNAGVEFSHYVIDNNSSDGTWEWVRSEYDHSRLSTSRLGKNEGISRGSNIALDIIQSAFESIGVVYDLIVKFDNDCRVVTPGILAAFADIYSQPESEGWVLGPRVEGLVNQPRRFEGPIIAGYKISAAPIVGGIFLVVPAAIFRQYRYPETLPLAKGQDDHFCDWLRINGYRKGYVDSLVVEHIDGTDGQARKYPEYFARKWREEQEVASHS